MAERAPTLESLVNDLGSLDADTRFEALGQVRRYATNGKASRAIYELRNDSDRRVRALAREILDEADRRTSESLSVPGAEVADKERRLDELLGELKAADATDRMTALKELRLYMPHPKIDAALQKLKRDPHRAVRLVVDQTILEAEAAKVEEAKPQRNIIVDNVLVSSPYSKRSNKVWKEKVADGMGAGLVPYLGFAYVVFGLPISLMCLWVWTGMQGVLPPAYAPDPAVVHFVDQLMVSRAADPLSLSLLFAVTALQSGSGLGVMLRLEWGRKGMLLYHCVITLFGFMMPNVWMKIIPGLLTTFIFYFLTRHEVASTFKGYDDKKGGGKGKGNAEYGNIERKVW